jgi:hypothetical protein
VPTRDSCTAAKGTVIRSLRRRGQSSREDDEQCELPEVLKGKLYADFTKPEDYEHRFWRNFAPAAYRRMTDEAARPSTALSRCAAGRCS